MQKHKHSIQEIATKQSKYQSSKKLKPINFFKNWVIFEEEREYRGDGLYIINYAGQLMVKLLQLDPVRKILDIVSVNKEYKSYSISLSESQVEIIIGKVLRCII